MCKFLMMRLSRLCGHIGCIRLCKWKSRMWNFVSECMFYWLCYTDSSKIQKYLCRHGMSGCSYWCRYNNWVENEPKCSNIRHVFVVTFLRTILNSKGCWVHVTQFFYWVGLKLQVGVEILLPIHVISSTCNLLKVKRNKATNKAPTLGGFQHTKI